MKSNHIIKIFTIINYQMKMLSIFYTLRLMLRSIKELNNEEIDNNITSYYAVCYRCNFTRCRKSIYRPNNDYENFNSSNQSERSNLDTNPRNSGYECPFTKDIISLIKRGRFINFRCEFPRYVW